jgi:transcriptional regulator with XRE-family HTH domain
VNDKALQGRKPKNYRDNELLKRVGENIRTARESKNLTIVDLSVAMSVDPTQVGRVERGIVNFTVSYLSLFAKALEVSMEDLLK